MLFRSLAGLPDPRPPVIGPAPSPHTPAVIAWTSGTTSAAKGVALSAAGISYVVSALVRAQGLHADDRLLSVLPPHHMLELSCSLLSALAAGATVTFAGTLMPNEILDTVAERRITKLVAVPLLADLLKRRLEAGATVAAASATSLEAVYCGGAPLDPRIIDFYAGLGIPVYQGYGLTETAPTIAMNTPAQNRPGSVGRPLPGTEVRITAPSAEGDGEILVRSPAVMLGYWRDEALTASVVDADGWLHTGDLGRVDSDGFLWITGRAKNVIVLDSGKKVHPEEVEAALAASDAIAEACVLGWRPPGSGLVGAEQVCAVVVASKPHAASHRGDARDAIEDEVRRRTAGLSGYKRPSMTRVVAGPLPRSAKGAVRLSAVRALLDQQERMR